MTANPVLSRELCVPATRRAGIVWREAFLEGLGVIPSRRTRSALRHCGMPGLTLEAGALPPGWRKEEILVMPSWP